MSTHPPGDIDPFFVFTYDPIGGPEQDPDPDGTPGWHGGQRFTTYWQVERGCRGPEPLPDWVVTDRGAIDTDLGVLKTGKEADVSLVQRAATDGTGASVIMAAKRYRGQEHRSFHRSAAYTEGRQVRRSRDTRALARKSTHGRAVAAGEWAFAEWDALTRYWQVGVPVPYPVQLDGTEILMEYIGDQDTGGAAPRLAQLRPAPDLLAEYFEQIRAVISLLAAQGVAHGDLSAYNILADGERLVVIDLPQVVDLVANPSGQEFLLRDCRNVCTWFTARGLPVDADELFAEVVCFTV